jgi:hypothetical protein
MELTNKETATVLAALRYWQDETRDYPELMDDFDHFEDIEPLTDQEINDLCERINLDHPQPSRISGPRLPED